MTQRTTISFDLDDTLICRGARAEPCNLLGRMMGAERLRLGTRRIFSFLSEHGITGAIYTTSLRPKWRIWLTFRFHGLRLGRIVNGDDHEHLLKERAGFVSKIPDAFGFDLHVDDSPIHEASCSTSTTVILVAPDDEEWADKIIDAVREHMRHRAVSKH